MNLEEQKQILKEDEARLETLREEVGRIRIAHQTSQIRDEQADKIRAIVGMIGALADGLKSDLCSQQTFDELMDWALEHMKEIARERATKN